MKSSQGLVSSTGEILALGLVSAAATAHQIALLQVLGWMHWHHFAYLIVAVALLGFGIAGTVLSLGREALTSHWRRILPWLLLGAAVTPPAGLRIAQLESLAVDLPLVFVEPATAWRLAALCGLLVPPFFCAGLATGLLLTLHAAQAGRFYAASLAGAGVGGLAGLAAVAHLAPPRLPAIAGMIALLAAASLWRHCGRRVRIGTVLTAAALIAIALQPGGLRPSQFKPVRRALELPDARTVAHAPGVHGWTQIVAAPALRPAPAVSLQFQGPVPVQPAVFVNGIGYGSLPDATALASPEWLEFTTDAAPFHTLQPARVLLLENGPGGWTALAARHGATRIDVVEPNASLLDLLLASDPPLAPEWRLRGVRVHAADGRAFLRRRGDADAAAGAYDLIRFPSVGALGGTAGYTAASEQFLLTREAFVEAWRRLTPSGAIAITAWMDFPERNALRLVATLAEAIEATGGLPRSHLAAVRSWAAVTFLVRRTPWIPSELAALRAFGAERGFDPLVLPDLRAEEREAHHAWQNPEFFRLVDVLVDGPREPLYRAYSFQLRPATDNRPYFSQFMRGREVPRVKAIFGAAIVPFFELGSIVVALTFAILTLLAVVGIVLPLVRLGWRAPGKAHVLLYFGGLGAGFMCVEIGAMLRAQAWLGSPVLAASLSITTLLVASGAGSLWSERLRACPAVQRGAIAAIVLAIFAASLLLGASGPRLASWPAGAHVALLIAILAASGFTMGLAFPLGVRRLEATHPGHIPWAWAVNGCVSVATPAGAMLLAMAAGFDALFLAAAAAYAVAFLGASLSGGRATPAT